MIGRDLRTIREACGVNMGELADAWGIPLPAVSDRERDVATVAAWAVVAYIGALAKVVRARTPVRIIDAGGEL